MNIHAILECAFGTENQNQKFVFVQDLIIVKFNMLHIIIYIYNNNIQIIIIIL